MKSKLIIGIMLLMLVTLTGCTNISAQKGTDLSGEYIYGDCVYLSAFFSTTIDIQTQLHKNIYYLNFSDDTMLYYSGEDELEASYENINYVSVEKDLNISDILYINLYGFSFDEFLDTIEYRYDIYRNNLTIGFTIFQSNSQTYIADTSMIGSSKDIFFIWSIFEIVKSE
jgi:hypothetical protein